MRETSSISPFYLKNPNVVLGEEDPDGSGLLFDPDTNQATTLNAVGLFIWQLCDGAHNLDDIAVAVQANFDSVPPDQMAQDVQAFIKDMLTAGLVAPKEQKAPVAK